MDDEDEILEQSANYVAELSKKARMELDPSRLQVDPALIGGSKPRVVDNWTEAKYARTLAQTGGGLDLNDMIALGMNDDGDDRKNALALKRIAEVTNHAVQAGARRVVQDAYMDPNDASLLMEQSAYQPRKADQGWSVTRYEATLQNGKRVPVFMVEDSLSGMTTGKRYRLHEVAQKVANVVNATGNPDDPRIAMINSTYEQYMEVRKSLGSASKALREGDTSKKGRVKVLEAKLSEISTKLGIS